MTSSTVESSRRDGEVGGQQVSNLMPRALKTRRGSVGKDPRKLDMAGRNGESECGSGHSEGKTYHGELG